MKSKSPAQSVIFNPGLLIGLCVFLFAVFLLALGEFAMANPSGLGRAFSNASAQLNLASRAPKAAQRKSGFRETHLPGKICCVLWVGNVLLSVARS